MAPAKKRQLKLGYSIWPTGHHRTAWRLPEADNSGTVDPAFMRDTIQTAERGLFDYYFIGNAVKSDPEAARANGNEVFKIEGYALGGYAAALTKKIGIVVTINITYSDPYNTARAIASLDHLSGGRTGLNVVTGAAGTDANFNFSRDIHPQAEDKYAQADEFLDVFNRLIGSWDEDWLVDDRINGAFLDPSKAHRLDHVGRFFSVRGPLNIPKTPQSRIPIIHAGTSEQSFELGAKYADVRFSPYRGRDWNQAYYSHIKGLLPKYERQADDQLVLPGFTFFVDETSRSAHDKYREVQDFTLNEYAPQVVSKFLGIDLSVADAREKVLDVINLDKLEAEAHRQKPLLTGMPGQSPDKSWVVRGALDAYGDPEHVTFNDLYRYIVNFPGNQSPVVGSAKEVADWIEERFEDREFDGVKIFPPYSPQPLAAFVDLVVPELQRRGIYRTEYESSTLLGHLGLDADKDQSKPS